MEVRERKKEKKGEGEEANWSETCKSLAEEEERKRKWFMLWDSPPFSLCVNCVFFPRKKKYSKV